MLRKLEESSGNALGYEAKDRITEEEFASFEEEFEAAISRHGKVRLLLYMPEIPRVNSGALWEDLKLARHTGDLERFAVVSASNLTEWSTRLGGALPGGEVRWFETSGAAFAIPGILGGLAVAAGPIVGGFLITNFGWPSIFYVNVPVGVVALALAFLIVPDLRPGRRHRLDVLGVLLATAGVLGITFGLIEGERYDWGEVFSFVTIPQIIGAGILLMLVFVATQYLRQDREPLLPFELFKDRNYSLMNLVAAAMGFAMLGLFLPLTIYLQSVLDLSALEAGLTVLPQALVMMFVAGPAGSLADRVGGKYILMAGLVLFALSMGYIDWIAEVDSGRWSFLPALILMGVGLGFTWAPMFGLAMRDIEPRIAGAAAGVIETVQEMGGVLAGAVVGAFLQNRLAVALREQAVERAEGLPPQFRDRFVDGFSNAAEGGLEVGGSQAAGGAQLPQQVQQLAEEVFKSGFVEAMHPSLLIPTAIVLLAATSSFAVKHRKGKAQPDEAEQQPEEVVA
jgi:EmrB/QacA subfamily drug resistance transporter